MTVTKRLTLNSGSFKHFFFFFGTTNRTKRPQHENQTSESKTGFRSPRPDGAVSSLRPLTGNWLCLFGISSRRFQMWELGISTGPKWREVEKQSVKAREERGDEGSCNASTLENVPPGRWVCSRSAWPPPPGPGSCRAEKTEKNTWLGSEQMHGEHALFLFPFIFYSFLL